MAKDKGKRIDLGSDLGLSRRDLLRRGAVVGGTLLWAAPAVQSITRPAFAGTQNGTPLHACCWCKGGSEPSAACNGQDSRTELGSDGECQAFCASANPDGSYEYHTSATVFVCGPTAGCIQAS
jgi:hypothetical protein